MTFNAKTVLKYTLSVIIIVGLAVYIYLQSQTYLQGPQLAITSPLDGTSTSTPFITVTGNVRNVAFITLDGNQIFVDEKGFFSEKLLLFSGYNIIDVSATDRFGRKIARQVHLTNIAKNNNQPLNIGTSSPPLFSNEQNATTTDKEEITN